VTFTPHSLASDFSPTISISAVEVSRALERLKQSKRVDANGIPSFVIKRRFHVFVSLLTCIFNLSPTRKTFPSLWKQTVIVVTIFKKLCSIVLNNSRPLFHLTMFPKFFYLLCVIIYTVFLNIGLILFGTIFINTFSLQTKPVTCINTHLTRG
jgi:hypothetical protein